MKPFHFQKFSIQQSSDVFRVGTDGVLLGAMCNVEYAKKILEVGTGSGIIALMMAQRNANAQILAIDINEDAAQLASENFNNSSFNQRLQIINADFKNFKIEEKFDLIVSNPPYFETSDSNKDKIARQTVELNFHQLISKSSRLLSENGILSVIIPFETGTEFIRIAQENQLFLLRKINIYGIGNSKIKRLILEFSLSKNPLQESDFVIEKSPRKYSDQYLDLTKDFHVFGK